MKQQTNDGKVEVQIMISADTLQRLNKVAELTKLHRDDVISVILAIEIVKGRYDAANKSRDQKSDVGTSKQSRVAKRAKSRRSSSKRSRKHVSASAKKRSR